MRIDPEEFSRHYATLSDDALLDINPDDLVDIARERYEAELRNRKLGHHYEDDVEPGSADAEGESDEASSFDGDSEWEDHAICACSFSQSSSSDTPAAHAAVASEALTASGIPNFIDSDPVDPSTGARPEYRVMIPAPLRLVAESVLDKEIFNTSLESDWATHFEELDDEQLLALSPDKLCAGILDRAARLKKALTSELAHRGIRRG